MTPDDAFSKLGRFSAGLRFEDIPPAVVERSGLILLDMIGAIAAGLKTPEMQALAAWCESLGRGPGSIALLWGSAGVLQELDEGFALARGHAAVHVIPAALAHAAEHGCDGRALVTAIVAGYEASARIGAAMQLRPGTHPHGTWGGVGTALAVARLRNLSAEDSARAMRIALCVPIATCYQTLRDGSPVRHLWSGIANLTGSMAASLAATNFIAPEQAATTSLAEIVGTSFDPQMATAALGERWDTLGGYFKIHACCRHGHASIDAVGDALAGRVIAPDDVAEMQVHTYGDAVRIMSPNELPHSTLGAKFSLPYVVAARLVHGRVGPEAFMAEAIADPRVRALAGKVLVAEDPELTRRGRASRGARVRIVLRNGESLSAAVDHSLGDPSRPFQHEEIVEKFRRLAYPVFGEARSRKIETAAANLPALKTCAEITTQMVL